MDINIERGRLGQRTRSVRVLLSRISFVAARRLPRLPWRQTSNSPRHNQLSQSSKCKTNTSLQTFNKGRNTGWWFIERCKMMRKHSLPRPTYVALAWACYCFGKISFPESPLIGPFIKKELAFQKHD